MSPSPPLSALAVAMLAAAGCTGTLGSQPCPGSCASDAGTADDGRAGGGGFLGADRPPRDGEGPRVPGLAADYLFDDGNGSVAVDSSGNFRNGGLIGGATWGTGRAGDDVSFDGATGYVVLPPHMVEEAHELTFAAWVKLRKDQPWQRIFDFGTGTGVYMFMTTHTELENLRFAITAHGATSEQQVNATTPPLPVGVWKHVAVVLNGTTGTLYVDGQPAGSNAMTLRPVDLGATSRNWLGRSQYASDAFLNGEIDHVRIYDRALSAAEIAALFEQS